MKLPVASALSVSGPRHHPRVGMNELLISLIRHILSLLITGISIVPMKCHCIVHGLILVAS